MSLWNTLLKQPLANLLFFLYQSTGENLGVSIILIGLILGIAMIPLIMPSLKSAKKMQEIKPQLDKLSKKHKNDKQALAKAQMDLYKKNQINPGASFLPTILRLLVVIALYQVLNIVVRTEGSISEINNLLYPFIRLPKDEILNTRFLYLDITKPDLIPQTLIPGIFLIASAAAQFFSSKLMQAKKPRVAPSKNKSNQEEMAESMQKQMIIMMPLMTIFIGYKLPSGLVLSWLTFSLTSLFQQIYFNKQDQKLKK